MADRTGSRVVLSGKERGTCSSTRTCGPRAARPRSASGPRSGRPEPSRASPTRHPPAGTVEAVDCFHPSCSNVTT
ncbi:hypothetical protein NKG05_16620 [Oerskovia sp. M15]